MDPAVDALSFEDALKELERIVSRLESGDASLQESIDLFERGNQLRRRCADRLDAAQARIEAIRLDPEGRPAGLQPFATQSSSAQSSSAQSSSAQSPPAHPSSAA